MPPQYFQIKPIFFSQKNVFLSNLNLQKPIMYMAFPFDEDLYLKALADNQIMWRKHALTKMAERGILRQDVLDVLNKKEIVRIYKDDKPFPSVLLLGFSDE